MAIDPGARQRHALGIDFGTSNTVAVARWPDGRARPILIDGSPLLPSAVYAEPGGQLIVGRDAVHSARLDPARFEPNPKRRVDDGTVLLGDREVPVPDLFAAVLARVAEEWHRAVGPVRPDVTLTCPATWGSTRRTLLAEAAADAGLHGARLVAEPVAAATYFAEVLGRDVPIGSVVVVHDFGAGTFDASVVARTAEGFRVLAVDGRDDIGGLDVDAAVVDHLGRMCGERDAEAWQRLCAPATVEQRRAQRQLWDDVRVAKERLSRTQSADLVVPLLDVEVHLTRDELEALAGPVLSQTVQVTESVLRWAELAEGRLAGVFLVGGASRIPLVATLLHRALGEAPVVIEQPELVVAEGSILADAAMLATGPAAPGPTAEMRLVAAMRSLPLPGNPAGAASDPVPGAAPTRAVLDAAPTRAVPTDAAPTTALPAPAVPADAAPMAVAPMAAVPTAAVPTAVVPTAAVPTAVVPAAAVPTTAVPTTAMRGAGRTAPATPEGIAPTTPDVLAPTWSPPAAAAGLGNRPEMPPAVDPWPHARDESWAPEPERRGEQPSWDDPERWHATPTSPAPPVSPAAYHRPVSPAPDLRPTSALRGAAPAPGAAARPVSGAARPVSPPVRRPAAVPAGPRRRRLGRTVRFMQLMLSMLLLLAVPLAAMVLAYGYRNGTPLEQDALDLARDIAEVLGLS